MSEDTQSDTPEAPAPKRDNPYSTLLAILGGGIALALVIFAIGYVAKGGDDSGGGGGGESSGEAVPITLTEFAIEGALTVPTDATLAVSNEGSQTHNLVFEDGPSTADLAAGESEDLSLSGVADGSYVVFCSIPGHREAGMEATMTIEAGATVDAGADGHSGANPDYAQIDQDMLDSFTPFVDALTSGVPNTEGIGAQPLEPVMDPDGYKRFDLTAKIVDWEVEPGKVVQAWTYNGMVPGPMIRVNIGDKVRIRLTNELPIGDDLHLHGLELPNSMDGVAPITQELIMTGESMDYEFVAAGPTGGPAVAMYHPHAHGYEKIPNGMWGPILVSSEEIIPRGQTVSGVEIPADVTLAKEDVMVLNDAGVIGLSLNGKGFPATQAYTMKQGDWAMFHYYNEGLQIHPMHLHQFPQLVVARDGIPLDQPYFADTVNVAPGERYSVMFQTTRPGVWVWHCHILTHAERESGMFGMVTAIAVE